MCSRACVILLKLVFFSHRSVKGKCDEVFYKYIIYTGRSECFYEK